MRTFVILAVLLSGMTSVEAKTFPLMKKVNVGMLHQELSAAGFAVQSVGWDPKTGKGWVDLDERERKDPAPVIRAHVYVSQRDIARKHQEKIRDLLAALKSHEEKLKKGELSAGERDQMLLTLLALLRMQMGSTE